MNKLKTNGLSETKTESNALAIAQEIALALCLILAFFVKLLYYIGDSIYNTFNKPLPKSVKGEIVLITGTGHGIGKELALLYASEGATVVGWDINEENNKKTMEEIANKNYPKAYSYVCDISNRENVLQVAEKVRRDVGDVTILINNAGIMPTHPLLEHTHKEIEKIMNINVMAHFWTIEAFLPAMKKNNNGHIVALSSMAGQLGLVNLVPYCASKFAVRGMMEALHEELRRHPKNNIHLTSIYPFMVDTGLCKNPVIKFPNLMPLQKPREVAEVIMHCQRNNILERSIPGYMRGFVNVPRWFMPFKAALDLKDSFEAFVDTDK
ncbi:short-chain dehydrogenase/reductase family 16C member 6-like [Aethina tumida]|uniref:short-chain dehydrogenase/reductase family 16C member 6-like n=1 Tax=Aethina tumida TaxID=116153 RepID=UPI002148021C|nr:short-chain dehydrogenase/reductase family 16C member 6-like [Aethina tumida]